MTSTKAQVPVAYAATSQGGPLPAGWQSPQAQLFVKAGDVIEVSVSSSMYMGHGGISWSFGTSGALTPIAAGGSNSIYNATFMTSTNWSTNWYSLSGLGLYLASQTGSVAFWFQLGGNTLFTSALTVVAAVVANAAGESSKLIRGAQGMAAATMSGSQDLSLGWTSTPASLEVEIGDIIQVISTWDMSNGAVGWTLQTSGPVQALANSAFNAQPFGTSGNSLNQELTSLFVATGSGTALFSIDTGLFGGVSATGQLSQPLIVAMVVSKAS